MNSYRLAVFALCAILTGCTTTSTEPVKDDVISAPEQTPPANIVEIPARPFPTDSFHDLLVAEFAVRRNRYDLALGKYLQQAHQTRDAGVTARATKLAQFLKADKATLDAAQLWVELEPDNLEARYTLATVLARSQRPRQALKHMTVVLEHKGHTNFSAIAANSLKLSKDTRQALEQEFDQLLIQHPKNTQLMTAKSLLLQQRKEPKSALSTIQQVLELDPADLHAIVIEARLLQQLDRHDEALVRLEQAVEQHPDNRRLRLQYARMLMSTDINKANLQFQHLLRSSPNDADLLLSLAIINKETDAPEQATHYLNRLLDLGKRTTEAHYYLGQLAERQQLTEQALHHYQQIPPGRHFLTAAGRVASLLQQREQLSTARSYLEKLRQRYPKLAIQIYLLESEFLQASQQPEDAYQLLREALLATPQQPNLLYARAMLSEKLDKFSVMEADLLEIIRLDPANVTALNALGYVLANRSERLDEAYRYINKAITLKPDDPAILDSLGWVEYRRGNLQRALELLTKAYQAFPDHEVASHLGEVLWQLGQRQEAEKIWREALQRQPDSSILKETIQRLTSAPAAHTNKP